MSEQWTLETIIGACGTPTQVAVGLGVTESAVRKMIRNGIHDRHWSALIAMGRGKFDASDIYRANEMARGASVEAAAAAHVEAAE